MTDTSFYTASGIASLNTFQTNVESGLAMSRMVTWASYTTTVTLADDVDCADCDATSGAFTVTLPASPTTGKVYVIRKSDASGNAVTIDGDSSDTIDGAATLALSSQYDRAKISWNGTEWARID